MIYSALLALDITKMTHRNDRYIERINNENNRLHTEKRFLEKENLELHLRINEELNRSKAFQTMLTDICSYFFVFVLVISSQIWCLDFWDGDKIRAGSIGTASLYVSMMLMTTCMVATTLYDMCA